MSLRDEVYEPLGFPIAPDPSPVPGARLARFAVLLTIPVVLAIALGAFAFGRQGARPVGQSLVTRAEPPPAPVRAEPAPPAPPRVDVSSRSPIASGDQVEATSEVRVTRGGEADAPTPLIIDVQQALAAQKAAAISSRR